MSLKSYINTSKVHTLYATFRLLKQTNKTQKKS